MSSNPFIDDVDDEPPPPKPQPPPPPALAAERARASSNPFEAFDEPVAAPAPPAAKPQPPAAATFNPFDDDSDGSGVDVTDEPVAESNPLRRRPSEQPIRVCASRGRAAARAAAASRRATAHHHHCLLVLPAARAHRDRAALLWRRHGPRLCGPPRSARHADICFELPARSLSAHRLIIERDAVRLVDALLGGSVVGTVASAPSPPPHPPLPVSLSPSLMLGCLRCVPSALLRYIYTEQFDPESLTGRGGALSLIRLTTRFESAGSSVCLEVEAIMRSRG